jgi:tRNA(Ile)-lysidine synthase
MITKFKQYILDNQLFEKKDRLLVAVSGGVDSIVLCHLLHKARYDFAIAHCNFQLRGEASKGDENFVTQYALNVEKKCFTKRFNTEGVAQKQKKGIQETARQLRYDWFDELMQMHDYQYLITAHHASDNIETFLFNLTRGAGLRGLKGILPKHNNIVRPLLWAKKEDILTYSKIKKIDYREDASNESDTYSRNYIRHHILPAFSVITPDFENKASETIAHLQEAQVLLEQYISDIRKKVVKTIDNQILIHKTLLLSYPSVSTILYEIVKDYGFNGNQAKQMLYEGSDKTKVGTQFYSATHILLVDRENYVIQALGNVQNTEGVTLTIQKEDTFLNTPYGKIIFEKSNVEILALSKDSRVAQLDFEKLAFPLTLRHWQQGDYFYPLGMQGRRQKVSDFFKNKKLSNFEKEKIYLLMTADGDICWIVDYRIDERFKITNSTKYCFSMTYEKIKRLSL